MVYAVSNLKGDQSVRTTYNKEINLAPEIIKEVLKTELYLKYSDISGQNRCNLLITIILWL